MVNNFVFMMYELTVEPVQIGNRIMLRNGKTTFFVTVFHGYFSRSITSQGVAQSRLHCNLYSCTKVCP